MSTPSHLARLVRLELGDQGRHNRVQAVDRQATMRAALKTPEHQARVFEILVEAGAAKMADGQILVRADNRWVPWHG